MHDWINQETITMVVVAVIAVFKYMERKQVIEAAASEKLLLGWSTLRDAIDTSVRAAEQRAKGVQVSGSDKRQDAVDGLALLLGKEWEKHYGNLLGLDGTELGGVVSSFLESSVAWLPPTEHTVEFTKEVKSEDS